MKLIKELLKQENAFSSDRFRMMKAVKAGNYYLSIQGSYGHYCTPRKSLPIDAYYELELAIFNENAKMVSINNDKLFKKFKRYDELLKHADGLNSNSTVYAYVAVDLLNDLYCFLIEKSEFNN